MNGKKIFTVICVLFTLILVFSITACGGKKGGSKTAGDSSTSPSSGGSAKSSQGKADNLTEAYSRYIEAKSSAYDRISSKIDEHDELAFSVGMSLLPVIMVDLSFIPLTVIGLGGGSEMALGMLGLNGIKIEQNGSNYTMSYTTQEGSSAVQTCEYDPATDSVKSSIKEDGKELFSFEYVKTAGGYAAQYTTGKNDGNEYTLIRGFFNDSNIAGFGFETFTGSPPSIFKNKNLDKNFVNSKEMYFMLENNQFKVYSNGELKTY